jgi:hypothetical protein
MKVFRFIFWIFSIPITFIVLGILYIVFDKGGYKKKDITFIELLKDGISYTYEDLVNKK